MLELATSALNDASGLLADAKQLVVSGMNGTLNDSDRAAIATQLRGLKERLMELANSRSGDAYLFGGTTTNSAPFEEVRLGGENKVIYNGNGDLQKVMVGLGVELAVNLPGDDIFSPNVPHGMSLAGLSGAAPGTTANMGTGFETLSMRHDGTTGTWRTVARMTRSLVCAMSWSMSLRAPCDLATGLRVPCRILRLPAPRMCVWLMRTARRSTSTSAAGTARRRPTH
jgi:flagellin-like hook-associated protein FlgL